MPNNFPILVGGTAAQRSTASLMKTGQITSYRTGDDGDLESGRGADFFTLAENNPFGNTNRFTDELGGQTYTNNIVIDWSTFDGLTVLGYYRTMSVRKAWNNAVDDALLTSVGIYTSGWYLPNINQIWNIANYETADGTMFNYTPFNLSSRMWSSTTSKLDTTTAFATIDTANQIIPVTKTVATTYRHIAVRNFTVTGTTLT